jgi:hypothetical protein
MAGVPVGKQPASGLRILAIVAAVTFGVLGVGCTGLVGLVMLGNNAETTFTPVDGRIGTTSVDGKGRFTPIEPSGPAPTQPYTNSVDDPVDAAETACEAAERDAEVGDWAFGDPPLGDPYGSPPPDDVEQYAQVVQVDAEGHAEWLASVDMDTGVIVADDEQSWTAEMGRRSTAVVCALSPTYVPGGTSPVCAEASTRPDGTHQPRVIVTATVSKVDVYALGSGRTLDDGEAYELFSEPATCPENPTESVLMPIDPELVKRWATEHIADGGVR